jgi:antitoxin component YwqK of YwqJK toxin-antitoxin module
MSAKPSRPKEHVQLHKDGSIWAKGQTLDGQPTGYWEWFRIDGTLMRSGFFEEGAQVGNWTTYDKVGKVYKVTKMKLKPIAKQQQEAKP